MQLKYRGISYEYQPPHVEMNPSGEVGQYRGIEWRFRNPKSLPVLKSNLDLVYRGVPYQKGPTATAQAPAAKRPAVTGVPVSAPIATSSVENLARSLMMAHHTLIKRREQSLLARAAAEVGLGVGAGQYWSPVQGKINSGFRQTYDRSHVALS